MFLSLQKIVFTAAVIFAVWYGWRWIGRKRAESLARHRKHERVKRQKKAPDADVVDLAPCPVCGDFVPPGGVRSCGRPDCPFRG